MTPPLSVIIPTLNEERALPATLRRLRSALPDAEIIVADGGSRDDTTTLARQSGARVVASPPGRGHQCRAGAAAARGAWLLFLHADTLLPPDADPVIATFARTSSRPIATFRLRFDTGSVFLRACAWFSRFDTVFTRFGDQGILVARALYDALGGIPDWPLMEDVEFLRRARRRIGRIPSLPACVETSSRRFRRNRELPQQLRNAVLLIRYLLGAAPEKLARSYNHENAHRAAPSRPPLPARLPARPAPDHATSRRA